MLPDFLDGGLQFPLVFELTTPFFLSFDPCEVMSLHRPVQRAGITFGLDSQRQSEWG